MTTQGKGTYDAAGWDEKPYDDNGGAKLTRAHFTNTFTGDIEGEGTADYLMAYPTDQTASFVGLQKIVGTIAGKKGSFVLQTSGDWNGGTAKAEWFVVPGSGTDALKGLHGKGSYEASHGTTAKYKLNYDFE